MEKKKSGVGEYWGRGKVRLRAGSYSTTSVSQLLTVFLAVSVLEPLTTCKKLLSCSIKARQQEEFPTVRKPETSLSQMSPQGVNII